VREVAPGETFMRLTQASTNYVALGEAGFTTLTRFVKSVPSRAIDYQSGEEAVALVEQAVGAAGMSRDAMLLVDALRDPAITTHALDAQGWTELLSMARAEQLIGTLAERLKSESVPPKSQKSLPKRGSMPIISGAPHLWEADCARRALAGYGGKVVLLKGTAYVAAG
jgi:hypothetical protein